MQAAEEKQITAAHGTITIESKRIGIKSNVKILGRNSKENFCFVVEELLIINAKKDARRSLKKNAKCDPKSITSANA